MASKTTKSDGADCLWVCDWCALIGDEHAARVHGKHAGHEIRRLTPELTDAVRAERRRVHIERAAAFVEFARARAGVGVAKYSYEDV